jgi:hypothetical protein
MNKTEVKILFIAGMLKKIQSKFKIKFLKIARSVKELWILLKMKHLIQKVPNNTDLKNKSRFRV